MYCVWCDQEIILEISWKNVLLLSKPKSLCGQCEEKLELLQGKRCNTCSRQSKESICADCIWWENHRLFEDPIVFNYSIFTYNGMMQEMIAKWKYRGDYFLVTAFKDVFTKEFSVKFSYLSTDVLIVPIPLSNERLLDRGFNQAKVLADLLPLKSKEIITRVHSEKQSKKTRSERISTNNPFAMNVSINKPVILVDDIYTTGTTLRHAATLLKENGCPEVYAYTLIRG